MKTIKTWHERLGGYPQAQVTSSKREQAMQAEIADLRAALAKAQAAPGGVSELPPYAMVFGGVRYYSEPQMKAALAQRAGSGEVWRNIATAPKDGTMLRLLVAFDDNATEDSADPCPTIGANNFDHDGVDEWKFAGWNWTHDCFTEGVGTPVGWLPLLCTAPPSPVQALTDELPDPDIIVTDTGCAWSYADNKEVKGEAFYSVKQVRAILAAAGVKGEKP